MISIRFVVPAAVSAMFAVPVAAQATNDTARVIDTMRVTGRSGSLIGTARSASEGRVMSSDIRRRPLAREGEVLENVPGMVVTQHSGNGKANQYFVRGFNLDHGTDFSTRLEGMPLNMPTHGHGQGYTDLNFLVPELVDYLDYRLGVHHTEIGDFGSAGGAEIQLVRRIDRPFVELTGGNFGFRRSVAAASLDTRAGTLLLGGEVKRFDGPWTLAEAARKRSGMIRYSTRGGTSSFDVLALAYANRWNATDQIPRRAVTEGLIGRFGFVDPTDGGAASRYSVSSTYRHVGSRALQTARAYAVRSNLDLFSNFAYFLDNQADGDQFEQVDRRTVLGADVSDVRSFDVANRSHATKIGSQVRADLIDDVGLHRSSGRTRTGTIRSDDVRQLSAGAFVEVESRWSERFRSIAGIRGDLLTYRVESDLDANSGRGSSGIWSPKLSLMWTATSAMELYASAGGGFHSNDARGATITVDPVSGDPAERVDPLVRSRGGELGLRLATAGSSRATLSIWTLDLASELLFVGDAGATEPTLGSSREGITVAGFTRLMRRITLDADASLARARLRDSDGSRLRIPGALEHVVAAGIAWEPANNRSTAALRLRHFGAYPLIEDNSVRSRAVTLVNIEAGLRVLDAASLRLHVLNALNNAADDIQYFYASRLRGESAAVDDVHFHPAEPRQLRVSVRVQF